jgi:hypothetical protein
MQIYINKMYTVHSTGVYSYIRVHVEGEETANKQIEMLMTELYRFVKTLVFSSFDNENKCIYFTFHFQVGCK